jgi:hypothetical protein
MKACQAVMMRAGFDPASDMSTKVTPLLPRKAARKVARRSVGTATRTGSPAWRLSAMIGTRDST